MSYPKLIEQAIEEFARLPGIGRRSAERIAFWFLSHTVEDAQNFSKAVRQLKEGLQFCQSCNHLTAEPVCPVCCDTSRNKTVVCVVEDPKDVIAIEKTGSYKGEYHVLLGTISPADGRGPDDIKAQHLVDRVKAGHIREVILATDPDNDGEMTALYLIKVLRPTGVKVSRIGMGLPMGGSVEFADISTLGVSLTSRREIID